MARSSILDLDEDAVDGGFGLNANYRHHITDPSLANAGQTHGLFEILFTYNLYSDSSQNHSYANFKLAKSILNSENLPNDFLGTTPLELVKKLVQDL